MITNCRFKIEDCRFKIFGIQFPLAFFILLFHSSCGIAPKGEIASHEKEITGNYSDTTKKRNPKLQDRFIGQIRSDVKTSFVNAIADTFESIKKLRNWLPSDEYMHKSTEAKHNNTPRTKEENHNIYLYDLYIFGVKREDDNDYHVILGSSKSLDNGQAFLSAEISGLPDTSSIFFNQLYDLREKFMAYFGSEVTNEYVFVASVKNPPIHLDYICGSLFFDNHHYGGHSKIANYKVFTAWEIHPVTAIQFHQKR